jgi:spoIIIJ-associated protein
MEWVETTAKTVEDARNLALDQLGVGDEDAEFEVLEEPRAGLFGLIRGEARVRARVRPTAVRPKQDRRRGRRERGQDDADDAADVPVAPGQAADAAASGSGGNGTTGPRREASARGPGRGSARGEGRGEARRGEGRGESRRDTRGGDRAGAARSFDRAEGEPVGEPIDPALVGEAAVRFVDGLVGAFGLSGTTSVEADGADLEVRVDGDGLGLLIGPGGRTLLAIQDITRVAAQRRLGDHDTRLRVDVAGYRERRRVALERFARSVADEVLSSGVARALEPMPSADRKVLHDALAEIDGVSSRSEGEDPVRRVIVSPG